MATPSATRTIRNPKTRFNWRISDIVRRSKSNWLSFKAKATGRGYRCVALEGESEYNITVNSDLTVSCNCQDYDGTGHIGDLKKNTFEEVFFGPVATKLREDLAKGKIPIPVCSRCGDLRRMTRAETKQPLPKGRLPYRGMLLENTVRCNVDCIGCAREGAANVRTSKQMSLDELSKMADLAQHLGLQQLFYLNLGEPFLSPNIGQEMPLLRAKLPDCRIVISTNGIILNTDAKREAAMYASHILFSVHGINNEMCEKYMIRSSFDKAYAAMRDMVAYRNARGLKAPVLEWKYLLFNWNDKPAMLRQAIQMAQDIGVDIISFWPTHNPFYGMSWRYRLGLLNRFGEKSWKGREWDFRTRGRIAA